MRKILFALVALATLMTFSQQTYCQERVTEPYIISFVPDSLSKHYECSRTMFITVSINERIGSDPTEKAIQELQKKIIETCKLNKMDGFILNKIEFVIYPSVGRLVGYGTMIRLKPKQT